MVGCAHHQIELGDVPLAKPTLARVHELTSQPVTAEVRIDREVVDPAAVPVVSHHRRAEKATRFIKGGQDRRSRAGQGSRHVSSRVVPRPGQPPLSILVCIRSAVAVQGDRAMDELVSAHVASWSSPVQIQALRDEIEAEFGRRPGTRMPSEPTDAPARTWPGEHLDLRTLGLNAAMPLRALRPRAARAVPRAGHKVPQHHEPTSSSPSYAARSHACGCGCTSATDAPTVSTKRACPGAPREARTWVSLSGRAQPQCAGDAVRRRQRQRHRQHVATTEPGSWSRTYRGTNVAASTRQLPWSRTHSRV